MPLPNPESDGRHTYEGKIMWVIMVKTLRAGAKLDYERTRAMDTPAEFFQFQQDTLDSDFFSELASSFPVRCAFIAAAEKGVERY